MTDQDQRIKVLEEQVKALTDSYEFMAKANNYNGDQFFGLVDVVESAIVSIQVLVEMLAQDEVLDADAFNKYKSTIKRVVRKQQLENSLEKEVEE